MATILAIDLGKFKSLACVYRTDSDAHTFETVPTRPQAMHDLIVARSSLCIYSGARHLG